MGETKYTSDTFLHKDSPYCKYSTVGELGASVRYKTFRVELSLGFSI